MIQESFLLGIDPEKTLNSNNTALQSSWASQVAPVVKNLPDSAGDANRLRCDPEVGKIPWRRTWQPTPVYLPGESPWMDYSLCSHIESDNVHSSTLQKPKIWKPPKCPLTDR